MFLERGGETVVYLSMPHCRAAEADLFKVVDAADALGLFAWRWTTPGHHGREDAMIAIYPPTHQY